MDKLVISPNEIPWMSIYDKDTDKLYFVEYKWHNEHGLHDDDRQSNVYKPYAIYEVNNSWRGWI